MDNKKNIDESWKENVDLEKQASPQDSEMAASEEVTFSTYLTSLILQTLIFLGEIPNPMAGDQLGVNLPQAKMLIDTLIVLREKTQGNLSKEEQALMTSGVYELQMKYVEKTNPGTETSAHSE